MLPKLHEHWREDHFHKFLLENHNKPFEWGTWDCSIFPADAILAYTGVDIADEFRGRYSTKVGAFRLIKTLTGGSTVADAAAYCANKHGLVEHEYPLMAKRGDLVVIENGDDLIAGVVHLSGRHVVSVGESGLVRLPITQIKRSWSV